MFNCSCIGIPSRDQTPTPPTPVPMEVLHSVCPFPQDVQELLDTPAGRRRPDLKDEYILVKYNQHIELIAKIANDLLNLWTEVVENYKKGIPISNAIMNFRLAMDTLSRHYLDFFRESSFRIDKRVQERKDTAKIGFTALHNLKFAVDSLSLQQPNFDGCEAKIHEVIKLASRLQACPAYDVSPISPRSQK